MRLGDVRDGLKEENKLLQRELRDMKLSKEAMIFEHEGLTKDQQILKLRAIISEYKRLEQKKFPTYSKKTDDKNFARMVLIVAKMNSRFDEDLKKYLFAIWRLKFMLKRAVRFKSENMALGFHAQGNEVISNSNQGNVMSLFRLLRCSIAGKIFELCLRSKDENSSKRESSYIIFKINLEEFIKNEDRNIVIILRLYREMVKMVGHLIPRADRIGKMHRQSDLKGIVEVDDAKSLNPLGVYDAEIRSTVNEWVETSIFQVQKKRRVTTSEPIERETLTLFRYLAIYYKCLYPYSNRQSYRVDADLFDYLENQVCRTIARLANLYDEDPVEELEEDY